MTDATLTDTGIRGGPIDYYDRARHTEIGRWSQLYGDTEQQHIPPAGALQHPIYRRELFLRFYEFHLRYRTHPGCVYFALPWLQEKYKLDAEQQLWLAFINGNTQNIVTSWIIFTACPDFKRGTGQELANFFSEHYRKLQFDTDRRYHKKDFLASVECYRKLTGGDQVGYFRGLVGNQEPKPAFDHVWKALRRDFYTFGRLSTFSYTEYLRLVGVNIECPTLFLRDMDGSRSHRNGLARVLGRDDLDWHTSTGFDGKYAPGQLDWLEREAEDLLYEARERTRSNPHVDPGHVHYHTLESAFCTFKSWFRPNRRYANCLAEGTKVLSPEGDVSIENLVDKKYPVYSMNEETGDIEFAWAQGSYSGEAGTVLVELDDGSVIEATPDHLFMTRKRTGPPTNGVQYTWMAAKDLKGCRLSPLHQFTSSWGYPSFYTHRTVDRASWEFVHKKYFEFRTGKSVREGFHIHHVNDRKEDSRFENLEEKLQTEHLQIHKNKPDGRGYEEVVSSLKGRRPHGITEAELLSIGREILARDGVLTTEGFARETKGLVSVYVPISRWGRWSNYLSAVQNNHRVVSVKKGRTVKVYDLSVEKNHNFYVGPGVLVHNCYADMMVNRIRYGETAWGKLKMVPFWKMRADCLPRHLRMEDCPNDPGLVPAKQNYFRSTGRPIMMSRDWPEFDNPFDRKCWS